MATVTGLTAERMQEIIDRQIVNGAVDLSGHLILTRDDGSDFDAGEVKGPTGVGPTGTILEFAGITAPEGWLICDGQAVSRTDYSALYFVIGTIYGEGDGTTTFNLPNRKGKTAVGMDSGQTEFDALGKTGGDKTVQLTVEQMPAHTHVQNSHNHTQNSHTHTQNSHNHTQNSHNHTQNSHNHSQDAHTHTTAINATTYNPPAGSSSYGASTGGNRPTGSTTATNNSATATNNSATATNDSTTATNQTATATNNAATATNQNTGGDGAHNNLQPYIVMNFIIKT